MNSQQNQKLNSEQSPSFDDVSKLFSLPLSEAADILGVSAAVLKKICIDNGLERWPHRKYLAGKSIEEIKKEAARERTKGLASSSGPQIKDNALRSPQEMSKLNVQQQLGSSSVFTLRPHLVAFTPNFSIETSSGLDEFKYGFPSDGLSASSNKWWGWGSGSPADHDKSESVDVFKLESKSSMNDDAIKTNLPEKAEGKMDEPESGGGTQEMGALSAIRKRALEEGRETLKFGFWNEFGAGKVSKKEKLLLARIFG